MKNTYFGFRYNCPSKFSSLVRPSNNSSTFNPKFFSPTPSGDDGFNGLFHFAPFVNETQHNLLLPRKSWQKNRMSQINETKEESREEETVSETLKVDQLSLADGDAGGGEHPPPKVDKQKIDVLLKATGNAPIMKKKKWTVDQEKKIGGVTEFIKKYLRLEPSENLFLYVNQAFAPSPDQTIKNLYECFGADGKLVLHYCKSQAWG